MVLFYKRMMMSLALQVGELCVWSAKTRRRPDNNKSVALFIPLVSRITPLGKQIHVLYDGMSQLCPRYGFCVHVFCGQRVG